MVDNSKKKKKIISKRLFLSLFQPKHNEKREKSNQIIIDGLTTWNGNWTDFNVDRNNNNKKAPIESHLIDLIYSKLVY